MPNARRWAARPANEAAIEGLAATACAPSTNPRSTATIVRVGPFRASGPRLRRRNPMATTAAASGPTRGDQRGERRTRVAPADEHPQADRAHRAERREPRARRHGQGVGLHEVPLLVDDVRQRHRQPGQHEPAEAHHGQRAEVEGGPGDPRHDDRGHRGDQHHARGVGGDEHPAAVPAVQQGADERAQDRVRHEEHGEAQGDGDGVGLPLGVEQHRPAEGRLEHAVAPLGGKSQPEQATVTPQPQEADHAQLFRGRRHRCG